MLGELAIIVSILATSMAYPGGPPDGVCRANGTRFMKPSEKKHEATMQTGPSPFKIEPEKSTVQPNEIITITVSGPKEFAGFMLYARRIGHLDPTGYFKTAGNEDLRSFCGNEYDQAAVSHKRVLNTTSYTLQYVAKGVEKGDQIEFLATIVQTKKIFWVQQPATSLIEVVSMSSTATETLNSPAAIAIMATAAIMANFNYFFY